MSPTRRFIDLSQLIETYEDNPYQQNAAISRTQIGAFATHEIDGYYLCQLTIGDQAATHLDASIHFNPEGTPVNEVPLEAMYGEACLLDLSHMPKHADVTIADLEAAAARAQVTISDFKIVMLRTDRSKLWGTPEYHDDLLNITVEATEWLINEGMVLLGVDMVTTELDRLAYGMDPDMAPSAPERHPGHCLMRKYEWFMIENLTNLDKIPRSTFTFSGFPLKIKGASGSPIRAVAILEE
jgi:kynurenine formamidase